MVISMIVTVVTPTLNAVKFLEQCIISVQRNASRDIEVEHVLVDGGSTDGTVELAQRLGLRVLKGKDRGIFDAVNKGSFNSSGELLGFLGADDLMLDGGLAHIVRVFHQQGRRWVAGGIRWIDEAGRNLGGFRVPPAWLTARMYVCLGWNPIMHMATYFSREFYDELGGFNPNFKDSGDFEMFARALARAPFAQVPHAVACFRRTGTNNSVVYRGRASRENDAILSAFGPSSALERACWRYLLKAWFNAANPDWYVRKLSHSVRWQLSLQDKRYF
jgi:glycosyltransferase involved in cell wall biosynthesis